VDIIPIWGWNPEYVRTIGGWSAFLQQEKGWVPSRKTYFFFDEAQLLYEDAELWGGFFKGLRDFPDRFAIAFASYGSPSSRILIRGTPIFVSDTQRVSLRPIDHDDGLGAVGLLFNRMELDGLVRKRLSSPDHYFDTSFFNKVFKITGGHVGAILDFVNIIAATTVRFFMMSNTLPDIVSQSYRRLKGTGRSYTWNLFLAEVNPRDFIIRLESSSSIFLRGLPIKSELQKTHIADTFIEVLKNNSIRQSDPTNEDAGLLECSSNGWLHADKSPDGKETVYTFASPLHRWFMEWRLLDTLDTIPFECDSILQLALGVIAGFSSSFLSAERRIGPGCIQRVPISR
jgi:hypothetical protein